MQGNISPAQYDVFSDLQKDDFQLKNESGHKNSKLIEFPYPETLLSKSSSSKKHHFRKIIKGNDFEEEGGLKRRLFGVKHFQNDSIEKSPLNERSQVYYNTPSPYMPQYVPQVIYKSYKYKQASFPYLIPF